MSDDQGIPASSPLNLPPMSDTPDPYDSEETIHFTPIGFRPEELSKPRHEIIQKNAEPIESRFVVPAEIDDAYLGPVEMDLIYFIERHHASNGESPTDEKLKTRFRGLTNEYLEYFKSHLLVQKSMKSRGIIYPNPTDLFTPEQLAAVSAILSYVDRRSDEKKLRDIGVTPRQWSGWLQDNNFAAYLRARSEKMLENSMHEAHLGLIKGIRGGNTASIKTYYEMTGRYNPTQENNLNIRMLLTYFIEVIQRYVTDPITLSRIATELNNIAAREVNTIQGDIVRR